MRATGPCPSPLGDRAPANRQPRGPSLDVMISSAQSSPTNGPTRPPILGLTWCGLRRTIDDLIKQYYTDTR